MTPDFTRLAVDLFAANDGNQPCGHPRENAAAWEDCATCQHIVAREDAEEDAARAAIEAAEDADLGDGHCPTCGAPATLADPGAPTPDTCPDCGAPQRATRPDLGDGPTKGPDDDLDW